MRKSALFGILLFGLSAPAYAGQQERAMVTGAATGAAIGAAIGSGNGEAGKGAIVGAFFGTIAGAILSDMNDRQPQTVRVVHDHRPVVHTPVYNRHRTVARRPVHARDHREARYRYSPRREHVKHEQYPRYSRYEMARLDRRGYRESPEKYRQRRPGRAHAHERD